MNEAPFSKFRSFYDSLVRSATSRGIVFADAQDLAGDAIERALSGFDPAKGEFPSFCHTILSNLMERRESEVCVEVVELERAFAGGMLIAADRKCRFDCDSRLFDIPSYEERKFWL